MLVSIDELLRNIRIVPTHLGIISYFTDQIDRQEC